MIGFVGYLCSLLLLVLVLVQQFEFRKRRVRTAEAAHEIRGSLTVIGFGLYSLGASDSPALKLQLERGVSALDELTSRTPGLVCAARAMPVVVLVDRIATAWRPLAAAHGRVLEVEIEDGLGSFSVPSEVELTAAVGNLISNAIDHGKGVIEISAARHGKGRIEFAVTDEGNDCHELVTAPYADGLRGRGLSIAERIARRNGSHLRLDHNRSTTTVVFDAPLVEAPR